MKRIVHEHALSGMILLLLILISPVAWGQVRKMTLEEAIASGLANNKGLVVSHLQTALQEQERKTGFAVPKTDVTLMVGQFNSISKRDNNITVVQEIPFPTVFTANARLGDSRIAESRLQTTVDVNDLVYQIRQTYFYLQYLDGIETILERQDSVLQAFGTVNGTSKSALVDKSLTEMLYGESLNRLAQVRAEEQQYLERLRILTGSVQEVALSDTVLAERAVMIQKASPEANPQLALMQQQVTTAAQQQKVEVAESLPDFRLGYFNQTLIGFQNVNGQDVYFSPSDRFQGVQVGLSIPLFYQGYGAEVRSADISKRIAQGNLEAYSESLGSEYRQALEAYEASRKNLDYYNQTAVPAARRLVTASMEAFKAGSIRHADHLQNLKSASETMEKQQEALLKYDLSVAKLMYLGGL